MSQLQQHEIFQKKTEENEEYLAISRFLLKILKEGLQKYGDGELYRFSLNRIAGMAEKANIELTRRQIGKVIYASFKKMGLDYYISSGGGRRAYETTLDQKKIKKLEEWIEGINFRLVLPGSFS